MKIAINGEIIDTKDIYKISDVNVEYNFSRPHFKFTMQLFNNIPIVVHNAADIFLDGTFTLKTESFKILKEKATKQDLIEHPIYVDAFNKISNLRNEIIKIWSENQSEIPQFNLE